MLGEAHSGLIPIAISEGQDREMPRLFVRRRGGHPVPHPQPLVLPLTMYVYPVTVAQTRLMVTTEWVGIGAGFSLTEQGTSGVVSKTSLINWLAEQLRMANGSRISL